MPIITANLQPGSPALWMMLSVFSYIPHAVSAQVRDYDVVQMRWHDTRNHPQKHNTTQFRIKSSEDFISKLDKDLLTQCYDLHMNYRMSHGHSKHMGMKGWLIQEISECFLSLDFISVSIC